MCDACEAFSPAEEDEVAHLAAEIESYRAQVAHLEGLVMRNAIQACHYEKFLRRIAYNPYDEVDSVALTRGIAKHGLEHTPAVPADATGSA